MLSTSIDTHSDAYMAGESMAPLLLAAIALAVLWIASRSWRNPQPVRIPEDVEPTAQLARKRTQQVALWTAAILLLAVADVVWVNRDSGQKGSASDEGPTSVAISPPMALGSYWLMTGEAADHLQARLAGRLPAGHTATFYATANNPKQPVLIIETDTGVTDQALAAELVEHSADFENATFMAAAKVVEPKVVPSGPAGGETQCGMNAEEVLCSWADADTTGALVAAATSGISVDQLAALTRDFRTAAEH